MAGSPGGRHWHLGIPGGAGTLELSESAGRVWVKVHPRRAGDWARRVARELATTGVESRSVDCDQTRPGIEFYRRGDVIDLLQPID